MRNFRNVALGFIGAAAVASASDVVQLKADTFPDFIKENDLVLAEFYAPWCGHCKALAPEYEEAATTLKEKSIKLAKVDCTEEAELCQSFGVEGYPTLKIFRGPDNISPYSGQRKAPDITSYMVKQSLPAVSILNKDSIEEFKTADNVVVVAYFDKDDKSSNETFTSVADELRDEFLFGATSDSALAKEAGVKVPAIVLYKSFDEGKDVFTSTFDKEAIAKFAKQASIPLVGEVGPATYAKYMDSGLPLAYIFAETEEERKTLAEELKPLAKKHLGALAFATIDATQYGGHAGNLNLKTDKFPAFAIQETVKDLKFPFEEDSELTAKNIGAFVQKFIDGKLKPSIKSEPIPETQEGPVQVIVAHTYEQIVMDDDKDVLVEFYAPWCGHCKALAPKYDELAGMYAAVPEFSKKVVVAKVDATANDVPDKIGGFPTIKLFPAGSKDSPITYSGSRTVEDLAKFIAENGKYKAELPASNETEDDTLMPDAEEMGKVAEAATKAAGDATEAVKSKASSAAEAVKSAAGAGDDHDEL